MLAIRLLFLVAVCAGYNLWPIPKAQQTAGTWKFHEGMNMESRGCDVYSMKDDGKCEQMCENVPNCLGFVQTSGLCYLKDCVGSLSKQEKFNASIFTPNTFAVDAAQFRWNCGQDPRVQRGCDRYKAFVFANKSSTPPTNIPSHVTVLSDLTVTVHNSTAPLSFDMDESYTLAISSSGIALTSATTWGALRGLETFSQLVFGSGSTFYTIETTVTDAPRFHFRGVMIDTARHYLTVPAILENIDAMAYNKFNVLHWHIVDDQSFPYVSTRYPELSTKGAWTPADIYTPQTIATIIEYAADRGIWVLPEFDTPAHSRSWGNGYPWLLTACNNGLGPMYPISDDVYGFMKNFWAEVQTTFYKSPYFHLGGDEVSFSCWENNATIVAFMKKQGWTKYNKLESYYVQHIVDIVDNLNAGVLTWQEVFDNGVNLPKSAIIDVWKSGTEEVAKVTKAGYKAVWSQPWYLNYIRYGSVWQDYYKADPQNFNGTQAQKDLVLGGEVCMWGEFVDSTNVVSRLWGNAAAPGERLWSPTSWTTEVDGAANRIHQQKCRMIARGIEAEVVTGPGHCAHPFVAHYHPPWAH